MFTEWTRESQKKLFTVNQQTPTNNSLTILFAIENPFLTRADCLPSLYHLNKKSTNRCSMYYRTMTSQKVSFVTVANQLLPCVTLWWTRYLLVLWLPHTLVALSTLKQIWARHNVKVAQKPFQTLRHIFSKPWDPISREQWTASAPKSFVRTCLPNQPYNWVE